MTATLMVTTQATPQVAKQLLGRQIQTNGAAAWLRWIERLEQDCLVGSIEDDRLILSCKKNFVNWWAVHWSGQLTSGENGTGIELQPFRHSVTRWGLALSWAAAAIGAASAFWLAWQVYTGSLGAIWSGAVAYLGLTSVALGILARTIPSRYRSLADQESQYIKSLIESALAADSSTQNQEAA